MNSVNNTHELKAFVEGQALMDDRSNVAFHARVEIETAEQHLRVRMKVMITFDGYNNPGRVTLIDEEKLIDSARFPEDFDARWQEFKYVDDSFLKISGHHRSNASIGSYTVTIQPD